MPQRIVIIGAGFAGFWSALSARRLLSMHHNDDIEVVVIAPEPQLTMRPRLYESNPASMVAPVTDIFRTTGVTFMAGKVEAIHTARTELEVMDSSGTQTTIPYDRLVLAAGSQIVHPNIPGLEHAFSADDLQEATKLDAHLHNLKSLSSSGARDTVVVCGAGFTGLEIATELPARLRAILGPDSRFRVVLVGREKQIGAPLGAGPLPVIQSTLDKLGVETKVGFGISGVDARGVTLESGERIETLTTIWTAGVAATPLTKQIDGKKDATGRLFVSHDLRVPSVKEVFATGDAACAAVDDAGNTSMMSCQHANIMGRVSGHNAAADLLNLPTTRYWQPSYVTCLALGPEAVVTTGWDRKVVCTGAVAKKAKTYINGTLIYPPNADNPAYALAQADPASFSGLPTEFGQRLLIAALSVIAFFMGFFK